ncbi:putative dehydrogenase [Pontibacter ummariensis]|uniref:Predicted dehydrogenase n=1 Tax=Pontibacter ummariensis TaxID=1610492 RepID=A0A239K3W8_9BACT|nr:Gfo/Idh/MocA family oxidoreductase [Pontibacter ummariensis]PRY06779.1 putative dehydrogenase [Pontibacter ummariensis]SNT12825.1 Predicted dehydrogenase [Pontibacter ummariensis]
MVNVGIIGYGYWGPNLVRNFYAAKDCCVRTVADARPERLQQLEKVFPSIEGVRDANDVIYNKNIDAVVIATPVSTHFTLARMALAEGKHVLLEKPMTSSVVEAEILINLAEQKGVLLMVDHTFLYTGAVQKMRQLVDSQELGNIKYLDSTRINLGLFQSDINVLWDLAPHDISILNYVVDERPYSVNATGITHTNNSIENIAYLTVNYASGFIAHFNCSWTSPVKVRMMLIGGDQKMILYNDLEPTEKIKVYDTGYSYSNDEEKNRVLVDYRTGDIHVPKIATTEALLGMANDFVSCIQDKKQPKSSCHLGLDVVRILEASNKSIKSCGREIVLEDATVPAIHNGHEVLI